MIRQRLRIQVFRPHLQIQAIQQRRVTPQTQMNLLQQEQATPVVQVTQIAFVNLAIRFLAIVVQKERRMLESAKVA